MYWPTPDQNEGRFGEDLRRFLEESDELFELESAASSSLLLRSVWLSGSRGRFPLRKRVIVGRESAFRFRNCTLPPSFRIQPAAPLATL